MAAKPTLVQLILNATAAGKSMLTAANAAAQKTLLSLVKGDVGLGNVDNTSDANKPVSTAQQTAIDAKIGGSVGSTTNRLAKSSGTGGLTLQSTGITVDSSNNVSGVGTVASGAIACSGNLVFAASPSSSGEIQRNGSSNNQGITLRESSTGCALAVTPSRVDIYATTGLRVYNNIGTVDGPITGGAITAYAALNLAQKTIATLPSAAASNGQRYMVTDSAVQAGRMAYCYGSVWRYEDGSAV